MVRRLRLERFATAASFLDAAAEFLVAREAEHNLLLGIGGILRDHPEVFPEPPYLAVVRDADAIALAAMRTPPQNLVLSEATDLNAVELVADDLAAAGVELPGVFGPKPVAARFAREWSRRTGLAAALDIQERTFRLTRVIPPRPAPGSWRLAEERDTRLIADWLGAFNREALPNEPPIPDLLPVARRWVERVGRQMYVWEVDGRVASIVGANSPTPNGIRIGPVYTPPEDRGHGYASSLTAAATQDQLDSGRSVCFLFTDLSNPTSNHIYQAIGYVAVSDVDTYRFVRREA